MTTEDTSDRRTHDRLREENRVSVTVLSAEEAPELEGKTFFCSTEDVSIGGLRLCIHVPAPIDSVLKLLVAFISPLRSFTHIGLVTWIKKTGGKYPYATGIQFTDSATREDADAWRGAIETKLGDRYI